MKVIVSYASSGSGHFKAAQAIYNYLKFQDKNLELKLIDVLENSNILFKNIYVYGYTFMVNYATWLWALSFYVTYAKFLRKFIKYVRFVINRLSTKKLAKILIKEKPDFIISTHFLPLEVATYLKRIGKLDSRLITIITDFGVHPFWLSKGTDLYVVASDFTKKQLILEGIDEERIKEFGMPVDLKFLIHYEKDLLRRKFNIDQNRFTALIVTGSFGIGPIEEIVDLLCRSIGMPKRHTQDLLHSAYRDIQILVVCAKNKRLYIRLKNKNYPNVKVYGFIDNIEELMALSDVIITKPGGLTISEILVMELVPIFISAIPGQETENIKLLQNYGIGINVEKAKDVKDIILDYKKYPDKLERIRENMRMIKKPYALGELYDVIRKNSIRNSG